MNKLKFLARVLLVRPRFALGYAIVFTVTLAAIFAPWITPYSPIEADSVNFLQPPSWLHPFGTDAVGMDIFSRAIYAPRIDLTIAVLGTLISAVVGTSIGALVGFHSNGRGPRVWLSFAVMRAADVLQAFPVFVFAIALVASLGQSIQTVVLAIAFVNAPIYLGFVSPVDPASVTAGGVKIFQVLPDSNGLTEVGVTLEDKKGITEWRVGGSSNVELITSPRTLRCMSVTSSGRSSMSKTISVTSG